MSSSRAVNTWREAASALGESGKHDWRTVRFYVVGETTAANLRRLADDIPPHYCATDIRGAAEAGTSERLAEFILGDLKQNPMDEADSKLLYLTGTRNRDTLTKILENGGIGLRSLAVYDTQPASDMGASLRTILNEESEGVYVYS